MTADELQANYPAIEAGGGVISVWPEANECVRIQLDTDGAGDFLFVSPLDARSLATQLLKAARWAEGDRT
mgnify:CR=1 FL=1